MPSRRQYMEVPFPEAFEEPGPGALPEYLQILRRRKGTVILITFLGLLTRPAAHASADANLPGSGVHRDPEPQ